MQPTWEVLVVALIGVVGTLGAAVFSQVWSSGREDRRWRQEQQADDRRWQRERQRQREQWQRDDAIRTTQHREEAYAQFALAVAKWGSVLNAEVARVGEHRDRRHHLEQLARLRTLAEQAEVACVPLLLYAPRESYVAADEVCQAMTPLLDGLSTDSPPGERIEQDLLNFRRISDLALDRARHDLGVVSTTRLPGDTGPSDATRS
jgi:hypothetical protein